MRNLIDWKVTAALVKVIVRGRLIPGNHKVVATLMVVEGETLCIVSITALLEYSK